MRVLCLYLPQWPAQRVRVAASAEARPVVVHALQRNRQQVVARCAAAAERRVMVGMPLAEAEASMRLFAKEALPAVKALPVAPLPAA